MKNHSKGNNNKNEIELLLRKALRIKQKPSQELNDSIIRQYEKNIEQRKITRLLSEKQKVLIEHKIYKYQSSKSQTL